MQLPGFYFDEERQRYFPITSNPNDTSINKKRKFHEEQHQHEEQLSQDQKLTTFHECYLRSQVLASNDDVKITLPDMKASYLLDETDVKLKNVHILDYNEKIITATSTIYQHYWILLTNFGRLIAFDVDCYSIKVIDKLDSTNLTSLKCVSLKVQNNQLFLHIRDETLNRQELKMYHLSPTSRDLEMIIKGFYTFESKAEIKDSIVCGYYFVIAFPNKIQFYNYKTRKLEYVNHLPSNTSIMSLDSYEINNKRHRLYIGCRNGTLLSALIASDTTLKGEYLKSYKTFKIKQLRSIISLRSTSVDGMIYISAITNFSRQSTSILLVDVLSINHSSRINCISQFDSDVQVLTKEQQVFEVTNDDHDILYGTLTNFQFFSTIYSERAVKNIEQDVHLPLISFTQLLKQQKLLLKYSACVTLANSKLYVICVTPNKNQSYNEDYAMRDTTTLIKITL